MSTDDVKFNSKKMEKMNKLPKGEFYNVRFDIDDSVLNQECFNQCSSSGNSGDIGITCNQTCGGVDSCYTAISGLIPNITNSWDFLSRNFCTNVNNIVVGDDSSTYNATLNNIFIVLSTGPQ